MGANGNGAAYTLSAPIDGVVNLLVERLRTGGGAMSPYTLALLTHTAVAVLCFALGRWGRL